MSTKHKDCNFGFTNTEIEELKVSLNEFMEENDFEKSGFANIEVNRAAVKIYETGGYVVINGKHHDFKFK